MTTSAEYPRTGVRGGGKFLHWYLYVFEATELAVFMFAACAFSVLLFHSGSRAIKAIPDHLVRQIIFGAIMGAIATGIIKSPLGKRSGAHFNPACTITYFSLRRIDRIDAAGYIVAHFIGAIAGVGIAALLFGKALAASGVDYAVSVPGDYGVWAALGAEIVMAIGFMSAVLWTVNRAELGRWTAYLVGLLIAVYLVVFGPISGVGLNPARTTGSAVFADLWTAIWLYFLAPVGGMLVGAAIYVRVKRNGRRAVLCAKLDPDPRQLCPFPCDYPGHRHTWEKAATPTPAATTS